MNPPKDALRVIKPTGPKYKGLNIEWIAMRYDHNTLKDKPTRAKVSMKLKGSNELYCEGIDIEDATPEELKMLWGALGEWCLKEARMKAASGGGFKVDKKFLDELKKMQNLQYTPPKISGMTGA